MNIKLPKLPKIDAKTATRTFYRQAAPGLLTGFMAGKVRGVPPLKAYAWLMENNLWEIVPDNRKPWLLGVRPWGLSAWMSLDWLYHALLKSNPPLAVMLVTSPKFQERMKGQLESLIEILDKKESQ